MAKQLVSQKHVLKIHSKRLKKSNWDLKITLEEAKKNKEVITLGDSQSLRFIDEIMEFYDREDRIRDFKSKMKILKKESANKDIKKKMMSLRDGLNQAKFNQHYVCVIVDSIADFNRMNKKTGILINGMPYKRFLGTTGGIKNSVVIYVSCGENGVYDRLNERIENGRNSKKMFIPAKLEAYRALSCSNSIAVSMPRGILVVDDCITHFKEDVIKIDDSDSDTPTLTYEKDYDVELIDSDGYGLILPSLMAIWARDLGEDYIPSGVCIRNAWTKGMVFTFEFDKFATEIAKNYKVKDVWGTERDIRDIDIILTASMLKLWDSYSSLEDYLENCDKYNWTFSVTKVCPEELENERTLNYQFIQSFKLTDEDIEELVQPTINEIKGSLGESYEHTLLFLRGLNMNESNAFVGSDDYVKALMVEKELLKDPYVKRRIYNMRKKRIQEAKVGVLNIRGNYAIISGDPYSLCQSVFGLEVTGLLKANQCYSKYWLDLHKRELEAGIDTNPIKEVIAMRAPMSCHNNIRKLQVSTSEDMEKWYKYMKTCLILSSWDTVTHAENGADKDSDCFTTTDNPVLLRRYEPLPAIFCVQKSAPKIIVTDESLAKSNKDGFGDEIGTTTNRTTEHYDLLALFKEDSEEYKELMYRIMCGQHFQQCAIDKIKGIKSKPMPKLWYDFKACRTSEEDSEEVRALKEFNARIVANKKPYFFIYIYPQLHKEYTTFMRDTNKKCERNFNMTLEDLLKMDTLSSEEYELVQYYYFQSPVSDTESVMNRICRYIENTFDKKDKALEEVPFDYSVLKTQKEYDKSQFKKIQKLYKEYNEEIQQYKMIIDTQRIKSEESNSQLAFIKEEFILKCSLICEDEEDLANILIDLCYQVNKTKQFAWDIAGHQIIHNLLQRNSYNINYVEKDEDGDIEYGGYKFKLKTINREV